MDISILVYDNGVLSISQHSYNIGYSMNLHKEQTQQDVHFFDENNSLVNKMDSYGLTAPAVITMSKGTEGEW
jgi:hypothetical protein